MKAMAIWAKQRPRRMCSPRHIPHNGTINSPSTHGDAQVGPAFHIPMTQERNVQDLPSQLDFD